MWQFLSNLTWWQWVIVLFLWTIAVISALSVYWLYRSYKKADEEAMLDEKLSRPRRAYQPKAG